MIYGNNKKWGEKPTVSKDLLGNTHLFKAYTSY